MSTSMQKKLYTFFIILFLLCVGLVYGNKNLQHFLTEKTLVLQNVFFKKNINPANDFSGTDLDERLAALELHNKSLQEENKKLQEELGLRSEESPKIPVRMVGGLSTLYGAFYVERPENLPMYEGMYVYGREGVALGLVEEVLSQTARVRFIGQDQKMIIEVLERSELMEIESSGTGMYKGTIPKSSEIILGDTAVLRGYPKAILGSVVDIREDDTSLKTIWIRAPYNVSKVDIFYVDRE